MCQECLTRHTITPQRLQRTGLARDITTHPILSMYQCTGGQVWGTYLRGWYVELIRHHSTPCLLYLVVAIVAPRLCLCEFSPQRLGVSELHRIVFTKEYSLRSAERGSPHLSGKQHAAVRCLGPFLLKPLLAVTPGRIAHGNIRPTVHLAPITLVLAITLQDYLLTPRIGIFFSLLLGSEDPRRSTSLVAAFQHDAWVLAAKVAHLVTVLVRVVC